jgi:hypothetical protein
MYPKLESQHSVLIPAVGVKSIFDFGLNATEGTNTSESIQFLVSAIQRSTVLEDSLASQLRILRSVLAVAIVDWGTENPAPGPVPITGYFASAGYRVTVSPISRALFTGLSLATLVWCLVGLLFCWVFGSPSPNTSQFPELNFAAKVTTDSGGGIPPWLAGLGNATNVTVRKRIQGKVLYVGSTPSDKGVDRVVIGTTPALKGLAFGRAYL